MSIFSEAVLVALLTGTVSALVNWGMVKVELRWLRADINRAHARLNALTGERQANE